MWVENFDLNNLCYQDNIEIKNKEMIKDFYDNHIDYWKNDIINFESIYKDFKINKVTKLVIWVSDILENKIVFSIYFLLENNKKIYFNVKYDDMVVWLKKFDLIG